ncbi:MAG TPA: tetratricopeptide repeat protein [Chthonomonadaceae bacterium]|nr:tetratricopeptide repeat protein [Chthonomonadaceae bacterium]
MSDLPGGTVTFLFTDIEGSTKLWEKHPEVMRTALACHDKLLKETIQRYGGHVFKTVGDAFCAAFTMAPAALSATIAAQRALLSESYEEIGALRVRMALHTGVAEQRDHDYFGPSLNRVARLLAIGHGGQVLLSKVTQALVRESLPAECDLKDMGSHRLKDLQDPEQVFQLLAADLPADFPPLRSLQSFANNLPVQLTSFIGREREIQEVKELLTKTRLLTLVGSGGSGKSRLALQVAADLIEQYPDGVWLVELASLSDPALVPQAVATALRVQEEPGRSLLQTLADTLKPKRLLLLLDNCEHLLNACAQLADALMRVSSQLTILASSREALGITGERSYRIPSLLLPDGALRTPVETLMQCDSVRLFADRATTYLPSFAVTHTNAPAVAQICRRLDGIPLAIELAAARVRVLPAEQIATRLDDRFRLLTGGSRAALPRQQTLRALIDWSYDLLSEPEKILLSRLSVFAGGWTLEAAEAVCADEQVEGWEVLDLMASLVDKSLVAFEQTTAKARYRLLETVRQYARDRLAEREEAPPLRGRHRDYYLALAVETAPHLQGPEMMVGLDTLETEHDNLRTALAWCREDAGDPQAGLRLAKALLRFWEMRGYLTEGREHLREHLARTDAQETTQLRAEALNGIGVLAYRQGDYIQARAYLEQALEINRAIGNQKGEAINLGNLGNVASYQGDYARAQAYYEQFLVISRERGQRAWEARILTNLGNLALHQESYETARSHYDQALTINREISNRAEEASTLGNLGEAAYYQQDYPLARAYYEQAIAIHQEIGNRDGEALVLVGLGNLARKQEELTHARSLYTQALQIRQQLGQKSELTIILEGFAALYAAMRQFERAARLYGAAEQLRAHRGEPLPPNQQHEQEETITAIRSALGEKVFPSAWAEGRLLTLDQALTHALEDAA